MTLFYLHFSELSFTIEDTIIHISGHHKVHMAKIENLGALQMTALESLLKDCMAQRPDVAEGILTSQELGQYVAWMSENYGERYAGVAQSILPYFIPDNGMTLLAAQALQNVGSRKTMARIYRQLETMDEAGNITTGQDISIRRMLRYLPDQWHSNTYCTF